MTSMHTIYPLYSIHQNVVHQVVNLLRCFQSEALVRPKKEMTRITPRPDMEMIIFHSQNFSFNVVWCQIHA